MHTILDLIYNRFEKFLVISFIFGLTLSTEWIARRTLVRYMRVRSIHENDTTNLKFLGNALSAIIYSIGIIFAIREYPPLRTFAGSLLTGAGILAAIIGLASQQAFSNIVSGIFLVIFKPFRVNDRLRLKDSYNGIVEDITLRHTILRDLENKRIIVPNSVMANEILVNSDYQEEPVVKFVEVRIAQNTKFERAKEIMCHLIRQHPKFYERPESIHHDIEKKSSEVKLIEMNEHGLLLRGYAWARNAAEGFDMYCDLLEQIKLQFDAEQITIAVPIREILIKSEPIITEK